LPVLPPVAETAKKENLGEPKRAADSLDAALKLCSIKLHYNCQRSCFKCKYWALLWMIQRNMIRRCILRIWNGLPQAPKILSRKSSRPSAAGRVDAEVNVQRAENVANRATHPVVYQYLLSNKDAKFHKIKLCFVQLQIPEEIGSVNGKLLIKIDTKLADAPSVIAEDAALREGSEEGVSESQ
jgi:hypothetical protein